MTNEQEKENVQEKEINAALQVAGITPNIVKREFMALFPETANILEGRGSQTATKEHLSLWVSFKGGLLAGYFLKSGKMVKRKNTGAKASEGKETPVEVKAK